MFIAVIGTRSAGKSSVEDFLVLVKDFTHVRLSTDDHDRSPLVTARTTSPKSDRSETDSESYATMHRNSFLSLNSPITPFASLMTPPLMSPITADFTSARTASSAREIWFSTPEEMLDFATRNWRRNFVTSDLVQKAVLEEFAIRPFFLLVGVDAPLLERFRRSSRVYINLDLEDFVREHDSILYGAALHADKPADHDLASSRTATSLHSLQSLVHVHIINSFRSIDALQAHLESLNLLDHDRLRPRWDTYFMHLAALASLRSNCMKRRVGAILVRNNRIVATGYNGTPRGLKNCNEGGCARCNGSSPSGHALDECVCLHAEENALLEAGRERVGGGSVLYCNTCPCLRCTIKIIQTGVTEVVYNLSYKVDDASQKLFEEAGVSLRRHAPS